MAGIQILPPKTGVLNRIGEGLERGISQANQVEFRQQQFDRAAKTLEGLDPNASPSQLLSSIAKAFGPIEGGEQFVQPYYQAALSQRSANPFGGEQRAAQGTPLQGQNVEMGAEPLPVQQRSQQNAQEAPYLQPPRSSREKEAAVARLAQGGLPAPQATAYVQQLSSLRDQDIEEFTNELKKQGFKDKELPFAVKIAQQIPAKDRQDAIIKTRKELNNLHSLGNFPSWGSALDSIFALGTKGIREGGIKGLEPNLRELYAKGLGNIAEEYLGDEVGLSPAEISTVSYRAREPEKFREFRQSFKNFNGARNPAVLENYIEKKLKEGIPILTLRYALGKEKGVDWRDFGTAYNSISEKGFRPSPEQFRETGFLSEPPRDSLASIFDHPIDFLLGKM